MGHQLSSEMSKLGFANGVIVSSERYLVGELRASSLVMFGGASARDLDPDRGAVGSMPRWAPGGAAGFVAWTRT